jgi:hypothetical protein
MVRVIVFTGLLGSLSLCLSCGGPSQGADSADQAENHAAIEAVEAWLKALDAGNYDESWRLSATVFRVGNGTPANWASAASEMRGPLGGVVRRQLKEIQKTNLQEGSAYALVYDTTFEARRSSTEEVTVVLDGGFWKVAGYLVK